MFLVVQLVAVCTGMGGLMTMLRDRLLLKFWVDWSTFILKVFFTEYVLTIYLFSSFPHASGLGSESRQYLGRNDGDMQNFRFRNIQTDRRYRSRRCPHSNARHHFLDGSRGRSYTEERLQFQNWYLECWLCRSWDVGGDEALDGWRDGGSYVQGWQVSAPFFLKFTLLHSCSNRNCHHLCRMTSFWARTHTTLDKNVSPCTTFFFWPWSPTHVSQKVTPKSDRLQRSSENIPISCSHLSGNLLDSLNQNSRPFYDYWLFLSPFHLLRSV